MLRYTLPVVETESDSAFELINVESSDGELFVSLNHEMSKKHYISFISYITADTVEIKKLYPEQNPECRFTKIGHGIIFAYCNRHGLFSVRV